MRAIAWIQWVRVAGAVLLLGAVCLPGVAHGAGARITPDTEDFLGGESFAVQAGTTFYAWTAEGESLDVNFARARGVADVELDATVSVTDPAGEVRGECEIKKSGKSGKTCGLTDLATPTAGIWRIAYHSSGDGKAIPANWDIVVTKGDSERTGRVWTDQYRVQQKPGSDADIGLYYLSELGFQYRAVYRGYNGLWSRFEAGVAGLTHPDSCVPIDHSTGGMSGEFAKDLAACGVYKIFFNEPAKDLPRAAPVAGGDETWLLGPAREAELGEVVYQPAGPHEVAGEFLVALSDHRGTIEIELDLNGDGDFDDDIDRTIVRGVSSVGANQVAIAWDGIAGNGNPVRYGREISVRANIDRIGTIYFVNSDVEGRSGGIEVEYLNGPQAGDRTVYWDDGAPNPRANAVDQSGHVDSLGGARSWDYGTDSWGNNRRIQEWSFVKVDLASPVAQVILPERPPKDSATGAGMVAWWQGPFGWVAGAGVITSIVGLGFLLFFSRRANRRELGDQSQLVGLP